MSRLDGRVAVVTGAGRGIGASLARAIVAVAIVVVVRMTQHHVHTEPAVVDQVGTALLLVVAMSLRVGRRSQHRRPKGPVGRLQVDAARAALDEEGEDERPQ